MFSKNLFFSRQKKHCAHSVTSDVSIGETASAASFFLADGLIVTGSSTGSQANPQDVLEAISGCNLPVLIGSGITPNNVSKFANAQGFIVGSYLKENGVWSANLDPERIQKMVQSVQK